MLALATFSGKAILITGAGTGIGKGFALRAAELGATVADYINGEALVADGGQWLNQGVFTLPESGKCYAKV